MKNTLSLDFRDNPELKTALGGKQPGDKISVEFDLLVKSVDDETLEAAIECIYCDEDGEKAEVEPEPDEPVMVVMRAKSSGKGKAAPEYKEDDAE